MGDPVLHSTISTNCSTFFHASPLHYHTIPPTLFFSRVDCSASDPQGVRLFPVNCRSFLLQITSSFLIPIVADISSLPLSLSLSLSPPLPRAYQQLRSVLQPQQHAPGPPFPYLGTFALPTEASRQRRSSSVTIIFYNTSMAIQNGSAVIDGSLV
ncbi:hypothetical protein BO83DRAFT_130324 [Aspergillus eucalypticola CBS 122712]|uniref:Uncharacterized protein n=1 Tax=Aspergillus eucalypticola (strain CBS 122712 / IBT 29274) TaxID=1448314 RepID=A0A317W8A2_ASPEC|nr:uncharacterized protein BO83DRAFT_130324 [Aspergillus eucalypticola CBS 122712]PWY82339.1 hypothetical protein BO83DRAFT_130324 [Aspergillus eucalypticola CBS 122712]